MGLGLRGNAWGQKAQERAGHRRRLSQQSRVEKVRGSGEEPEIRFQKEGQGQLAGCG